jgi:predicted NUDIX family phosphoesterase
MAQEEKVLVVERNVLEHIGMFQGLTFDVDRYLHKLFVPGVPRFMLRSQAEKDPAYKQLIPYVIMTCDGKYLSYVRGRRAGETRLAGNRSIGIGGHINPADNEVPLFDTDFRKMYNIAVEREVAEEVSVETSHNERVVALLNDESNDVGRVHLGIVHIWILDAPKVNKREQMITQMAFMTPAELQEVQDTMETWSGLCLSHLADMIEHGKSGIQINPLQSSPTENRGLV